jgi:hypothetical protein
MKHAIGILAVVVGLLGVAVQPAAAQFGGPYAPNYGPGYRPQLPAAILLGNPFNSNGNLGNLNAGVNYLLYRNELSRRANFQQTREGFAEIERQLQRPPLAEEDVLLRPLNSTGHLTAFGNTGAYFGTGYPRLTNPGAITSRAYTPQRPRGTR